MSKLLAILEPLIKILKIFFGFNPKKANVEDENLNAIKTRLETIEQTEEVQEAKKAIDYIKTLPEKERVKKDKEIVKIQKILDNTKADPISEERAKSVIEKYKEKHKKT